MTSDAKHAILAVLTVWFVLGGLTRWRSMRGAGQATYIGGLVLLLALHLREIVQTVVARLRAPPAWDIGIFWLWGQVALHTHRIYDPASSISIGSALSHDPSWREQVLNVGFVYPPPTILLFAPLGLFHSFQSATPFWYAVNLIALAAAIFVLWKAFLPQYALAGLLAVAVLVIAFGATNDTLHNGQPVIVAMLFTGMLVLDRAALRRGLWLGLAWIVKPLAIVLLLQPLLKRGWRELESAIGTIALAFFGAALLVGWQNVAAFFTDGPSKRYPVSMWLDPQDGNESLFSGVLRITHSPVPDSLLHARLFLICAAVMTGLTVTLCAKSGNRVATLSLLIALALLIFPPSAAYYNDLLLVPVIALYAQAASAQRVAVIAYISALYALLVYSTVFNILAPLSIWLIFAWLLISDTRVETVQPSATSGAAARGLRSVSRFGGST